MSSASRLGIFHPSLWKWRFSNRDLWPTKMWYPSWDIWNSDARMQDCRLQWVYLGWSKSESKQEWVIISPQIYTLFDGHYNPPQQHLNGCFNDFCFIPSWGEDHPIEFYRALWVFSEAHTEVSSGMGAGFRYSGAYAGFTAFVSESGLSSLQVQAPDFSKQKMWKTLVGWTVATVSK